MKNSLKCQKLENLKYIYACLCAWSLSRVRLFVTLWIVAHQVSLSVGFSRQEYWKHWSGLPFTTPGDLPDSGIEPKCPVSPALAGRFFTTVPSGKSHIYVYIHYIYIYSPWGCKESDMTERLNWTDIYICVCVCVCVCVCTHTYTEGEQGRERVCLIKLSYFLISKCIHYR